MARVLVYGGSGALGKSIVSAFRASQYEVLCIDFRLNDEASHNIQLVDTPWRDTASFVSAELNSYLKGGKLDAIINVAGGWQGGNAASPDFLESVDKMYQQSTTSSVISAYLAAHHLKEKGVLVLTGAAAAVNATPGMIGYGMAKASTHHLVKSLAGPESGMPFEAKTCAILPVTLDTPMNRKFMPDADFSTWTPLPVIAQMLLSLVRGLQSFENGSLFKIVTANYETSFDKL